MGALLLPTWSPLTLQGRGLIITLQELKSQSFLTPPQHVVRMPHYSWLKNKSKHLKWSPWLVGMAAFPCSWAKVEVFTDRGGWGPIFFCGVWSKLVTCLKVFCLAAPFLVLWLKAEEAFVLFHLWLLMFLGWQFPQHLALYTWDKKETREFSAMSAFELWGP